jgi:hypothetical protein
VVVWEDKIENHDVKYRSIAGNFYDIMVCIAPFEHAQGIPTLHWVLVPGMHLLYIEPVASMIINIGAKKKTGVVKYKI